MKLQLGLCVKVAVRNLCKSLRLEPCVKAVKVAVRTSVEIAVRNLVEVAVKTLVKVAVRTLVEVVYVASPSPHPTLQVTAVETEKDK